MEPKNWSLHVEWAFLVATMLGAFYLMHSDTQQQMARSDAIMVQTTARSDAIMEQTTARSDALRQELTARSDRLYEMFIDLVKEGKCPKQEVDTKEQQKHIAILPPS